MTIATRTPRTQPPEAPPQTVSIAGRRSLCREASGRMWTDHSYSTGRIGRIPVEVAHKEAVFSIHMLNLLSEASISVHPSRGGCGPLVGLVHRVRSACGLRVYGDA